MPSFKFKNNFTFRGMKSITLYEQSLDSFNTRAGGGYSYQSAVRLKHRVSHIKRINNSYKQSIDQQMYAYLTFLRLTTTIVVVPHR